jgi:hypothetical protein
LVAGDTWRWTRTFADYPAPTWTVTYYFENQEKQFSAAATASGTDHAISIAATSATDYPPGRYRWFARAVSGLISETIAGESGWLEVEPDPAVAGTRDHRSFARRALDAIEATIEGRATSGQLSFAIRDRTVQSFTIEELHEAARHDEKRGASGGRRQRRRSGPVHQSEADAVASFWKSAVGTARAFCGVSHD